MEVDGGWICSVEICEFWELSKVIYFVVLKILILSLSEIKRINVLGWFDINLIIVKWLIKWEVMVGFLGGELYLC